MTRTDRLYAVLVALMGPQHEVPTPTASLRDDLNMDSLDLVEFVMDIEQEFKVEISDAAAEKWQTYGDAMKFVTAIPEQVEVSSGR